MMIDSRKVLVYARNALTPMAEAADYYSTGVHRKVAPDALPCGPALLVGHLREAKTAVAIIDEWLAAAAEKIDQRDDDPPFAPDPPNPASTVEIDEEAHEHGYCEADMFSDWYGCDSDKRKRLTDAFARSYMAAKAAGKIEARALFDETNAELTASEIAAAVRLANRTIEPIAHRPIAPACEGSASAMVIRALNSCGFTIVRADTIAERDEARRLFEETNAELTALVSWAAAADGEPDLLLTSWRAADIRRHAAEDLAAAFKAKLETPTPEMIATAWKAFRRDRMGHLGPGPGFVEAIRAAGREAVGAPAAAPACDR